MTIGIVRPIDIDQEMQKAYLDYAMSVIVARALPDVRDGLKPVHRRILYAMHDMGLTSDKSFKKSARIVGEVLGKYHPHGDAAVYEAMVRMAQDFSLRYMLVDGQGNFGSVDGDNAAAMRYTEARLARIAGTVLADIEKDTVAFGPNFDESLREPTILPALLPNLLVNGATGIAVGMSTNVPPHNLGEVCDALVYLIDNYKRVDDVRPEDLMQFIQGPDFPTGGLVFRYGRTSTGEQEDLIAQSYAVGKGRFVIQAKAHLEEMSRSRHRIVVTELPYMTNKTRLLERIAELVREGRLEGIADLRDESDRTGMRVVIELTRTVDPQQVLDELLRLTPMQQTFAVSLLALVDGEPRLLSLKKILIHYVEHRREIVRRRAEFDLARARARAHIVEGLLIALKNLDEVIQIIRSSRTTDTARANLMKRFQLSEIQAQAILDMPLKRLAQLERQKLEQEYKDLVRLIASLEALLASPTKMLALIQDELRQLKATYGDARRTQIVEGAKGRLSVHDLLPDQDVLLTASREGALTRRPLEELTADALRTLAPSAEGALLRANTRHALALFSRDGRAVRLGLHQVAEGAGAHWADLSGFTRRDRLVAAVALAPNLSADSFLVFVSRLGKIKRVALSDFVNVVNQEPAMIFNLSLEDKDELGWAFVAQDGQDLMVVSRQGQAIRFKDEEVRPVGLAAGGVNAIKLGSRDQVIHAAPAAAELITWSEFGFGKRSALTDFPTQGRAGGGVIAHSLNARTGNLAQAVMATPDSLLAVESSQAGWRILPAANLPLAGRSTQGKVLLPLAGSERITGLLVAAGGSEDGGSARGNGDRRTGQEMPPSTPAAPKQATAPKQAAAPKQATAAPKQATAAPKQATAAPKQTAAAPKQTAAAAKQAAAAVPKQVADAALKRAAVTPKQAAAVPKQAAAVPKQAAAAVPKQAADAALKQAADAAPKQAAVTPKRAAVTPKQAADAAPKQVADAAPKRAAVTPKQAAAVPKQAADAAPKQVADAAPKQVADAAPKQVADAAPKQTAAPTQTPKVTSRRSDAAPRAGGGAKA